MNKLYNYTDKNFCYEMQRLMLCKKGKECIGTVKNKEKKQMEIILKKGIKEKKERIVNKAREFRIKQNEFLNIKNFHFLFNL